MTRRRLLLLLPFVSLFLLINTGYCQVGKGSNEELALQYARDLYSGTLSDQAGIYHGTDYIGYAHAVKKGDPFFLSPDVRNGEIHYDGRLYKNVLMWYDIVRNEVIVRYIDSVSRISLHNEKIAEFTIAGHHYINMDDKTPGKYNLDNGFYDQIYKGKSEIMVKRAKDFLISTDIDGVWISFSGEKNNVFLRTGEKYQLVSSQKSVLKALGKFEKDIQAHLKQSKVSFRKEREKAIIMMVAYYDQLNSRI